MGLLDLPPEVSPHCPGFMLRENGFRIDFENGWAISVAFTDGCYCDNWDKRETNLFGGFEHIRVFMEAYNVSPENCPKWIECPNAEIAIIDPEGHIRTDEVAKQVCLGAGDSVIGYMSPAEFLRLANATARQDR